MRGKRVVWPQRGKVEVEEFDISDIHENQVLVKTDVSLISPGTERAFLLGLPNTSKTYPQYPGYSNVGEVIEVGAKVDNIVVGDKVASSAGHSSHVRLSANSVLKVSEELESEQAVFFNLCAISLQGVRKAQVELGESVLVIGQGLIGMLALQLAKLSGAFPAVASDLSEYRLKLAKECGADFALNPKDKKFQEKLNEITDLQGPSVVIESTGSTEPVNEALKLAGQCGRVILLASTRGVNEEVNFYRYVHRKGIKIIGAHASVRPHHDSSPGFWTSQADRKLTLSLLTKERLIVDKLITHRFNGEQASSAYKLLMDWDERLLGVILFWN